MGLTFLLLNLTFSILQYMYVCMYIQWILFMDLSASSFVSHLIFADSVASVYLVVASGWLPFVMEIAYL